MKKTTILIASGFIILNLKYSDVLAQSFGNFTYTNVGGEITITSYTNSSNLSPTIPSAISNMPVTKIGANSFQQKPITNIIVPYGIIEIGENAFANCSALTEVSLPLTLNKIKSGAFYRTGLTKLVIPNSVTHIATNAFQYCNSITNVTIPDSVTTIESFAFGNCGALRQVTLGRGIITVHNAAFSQNNLLTNVVINSTWSPTNANISAFNIAFTNCSSLRDVSLGLAVSTVPESFFRGNLTVTNILLPNSLTSINANAFRECNALKNV